MGLPIYTEDDGPVVEMRIKLPEFRRDFIEQRCRSSELFGGELDGPQKLSLTDDTQVAAEIPKKNVSL